MLYECFLHNGDVRGSGGHWHKKQFNSPEHALNYFRKVHGTKSIYLATPEEFSKIYKDAGVIYEYINVCEIDPNKWPGENVGTITNGKAYFSATK